MKTETMIESALSSVSAIQRWLRSTPFEAVIIPSTDEFLSEFAPPWNRRLRWATGFTGSTGVAVIAREAAVLFVDGRYYAQAQQEVLPSITVCPAGLESRSEWLRTYVPAGGGLGIDPNVHSVLDYRQWKQLAHDVGANLVETANPIDILWQTDRPVPELSPFKSYPVEYAGLSVDEKCSALFEHMRLGGIHGFLVGHPEDVSWLLNIRLGADALRTPLGEWHIVPGCPGYVIMDSSGALRWFVDSRCVDESLVSSLPSNISVQPIDDVSWGFEEIALNGAVAGDPKRLPASLVLSIEHETTFLADDFVAQRRWLKHPREICAAQNAHLCDAVAVTEFMAWLCAAYQDAPLSEFEAAQALEQFRRRNRSYLGPSMPIMSASGANSSKPHYVPCSLPTNQRLQDHPIYWVDSGGQYLGGSTDNTVTWALGSPEAKHIWAHTHVLKALIALTTAKVPVGVSAIHLDVIARQVLWREGMDYGHGTGHGVGNFLNIHEGPSVYWKIVPATTVEILPGMILANEPGFYSEGDFGIRLETHMVVHNSSVDGFLEFDTISRFPIDPDLIDFELLTSKETEWLADYHESILEDIGGKLSVHANKWLTEISGTFRARSVQIQH